MSNFSYVYCQKAFARNNVKAKDNLKEVVASIFPNCFFTFLKVRSKQLLVKKLLVCLVLKQKKHETSSGLALLKK